MCTVCQAGLGELLRTSVKPQASPALIGGLYLFRRSPLEEERVPWLLERERDDPPEDLALLGAGLELRDLDGALRVEGAGLLRLLERDAELARVELPELLLREALLPL